MHSETTAPQLPKKRAPRNKTNSKTTTTTHESNEDVVTRETRPRRKSIMPVSSVVEEATVAQKSTKRKRNSLPVSKKVREHNEAPPAKKLKNETKTATASQLKRIEFDTNLEIIDEEHEPSTSQDADDEGGEEEDQNDGEEQMVSHFPYSVGDLVEAKDLKKNADIWYPAKVIEVKIDAKKETETF